MYREGHQRVRSSSAQTVAGPEHRPKEKCWSTMDSPSRLTTSGPPSSSLPVGTDLVALRDEFARAKTATWCGWSSARVTSASLRRWELRRCRFASQPLHSMLSIFIIVVLLSPQAVVKALVIHEVEDPAEPTTSHYLHLLLCPACGMERKCSKCRILGAGQVG